MFLAILALAIVPAIAFAGSSNGQGAFKVPLTSVTTTTTSTTSSTSSATTTTTTSDTTSSTTSTTSTTTATCTNPKGKTIPCPAKGGSDDSGSSSSAATNATERNETDNGKGSTNSSANSNNNNGNKNNNNGDNNNLGFVIFNNPSGKNHNSMINLVVNKGAPGNYSVVVSNGTLTMTLGSFNVSSHGHGQFHFNGNITSDLNGFVLTLQQSGNAIYQALLSTLKH